MFKPRSIPVLQNCSLIIVSTCIVLFSCNQKTVEENNSIFQDVDNAVVIDLNNLAYTAADIHDGFNSFAGVRALTMLHLSLHDIFNSVEKNYQPYSYYFQTEDIYPEVAAAISAKVILAGAFPNQVTMINDACNYWVNKFEMNERKEKSMFFGLEVAQHYLKLRENDGHDQNGDYTPMTKPGDYQYTAGYDFVWKPDFSVATPFAIDSTAQFRVTAPPSINSEQYAIDYQEVKEMGVRNSTIRTEDETNYAHWWAEFGEHGWNRIGRLTASQTDLPIVETNRMFALINMTLYDLYLASFESKYHYDTWRPETAIRNGETDDNPTTTGDPNWQPEMQTPPWPDYPSTHAAVGAIGAEIAHHVYGKDDVSFTMQSVSALPTAKTRSYSSLNQAMIDCANSRIMNGYHFRFATEEGIAQGKNIVRFILAHELEPL